MAQQIADPSPRKTARMAGVFYLIFILTTVLATYVRSRFIVSGDAAATANNIMVASASSRMTQHITNGEKQRIQSRTVWKSRAQ